MFITKLWRGRYSLVISYWLFGVLGNALLSIPAALIDLTSSPEKQWAFLTITLAYTVFVNVGIWRSATNYLGLKLWKILTKITVIISTSLTIITLTTLALNVEIPLFKKGFLLVTECQLNEVLQANSGLETQVWVASSIPCSETTKANLIKALGYGDSYIDTRVKEFNGKLDVNTVLLDEAVKAKRFYPVNTYATVSQCKLAELKRVKNQTAIPFVTSLIDSYCNQYVAVNLSMQRDFQLGKAMSEGYSYKEIAEYIEANPPKK